MERRKESTLDAFARAMSVRNRTSPARLGLRESESGEGGGEKAGSGKLAVPTINWSLRFSFCGRHVNVTSPVAIPLPPLPIHLHPTYLPISDKLSFVLRIASVFYAGGLGERSTSPVRTLPTDGPTICRPPTSGFIGENLQIFKTGLLFERID